MKSESKSNDDGMDGRHQWIFSIVSKDSMLHREGSKPSSTTPVSECDAVLEGKKKRPYPTCDITIHLSGSQRRTESYWFCLAHLSETNAKAFCALVDGEFILPAFSSANIFVDAAFGLHNRLLLDLLFSSPL